MPARPRRAERPTWPFPRPGAFFATTVCCKESLMSRKLRAAVAQMGPVHLADSRAAVVRRLIALLREAHGEGARFVVFPELALTTFFPRWWMTDQGEIDKFFEAQMPGPETQPLFELARELDIGFYLGYAE